MDYSTVCLCGEAIPAGAGICDKCAGWEQYDDAMRDRNALPPGKKKSKSLEPTTIALAFQKTLQTAAKLRRNFPK